MQNYQQTILSQYANDPALTGLIAAFNEWLDPSADLDSFYNDFWNVATAIGVGLDFWGKIVGVDRQIAVGPISNYLGFEEALPTSFAFGQQPFYGGPTASSVVALSDDAYRLLIMVKAAANISDFTPGSINRILRLLFPGRGSCYVLESGPMAISYVFHFPLALWEISVVSQSLFMPRPAGVATAILIQPPLESRRITESGAFRITESGAPRIVE